MAKLGLRWFVGACLFPVFLATGAWANIPGGNGDRADIKLSKHGDEYDMVNGNLTVSVDCSHATVTSMKFHGTDLVNHEGAHDQIYWSMDGGKDYQNPSHMSCTIKSNTPDMADIGCKETYSGAQPHAFDIEIHYVLRRGATGLYVYAILSHPASYPETSVGEWRIVWQTPQLGSKWLLERIYVDKTRHWTMPTPDDYAHRIATPIKEISILSTGAWKNQMESKYTYNANYEDIGTFGFASDVHKLGAFTVLGGYDYYNDGPRKQDLTALEGGMTHHFGRNHFGDTGIHVEAGEQWSKIFGPFLLYANGGSDGDTLWRDAQQQAAAERSAWPYDWLKGVAEYPSAAERGGIAGKFTVKDALKPNQFSAGAWIGLTQPPLGKDFQSETKNYQYWSRVEPDGAFSIPNVRPGEYTLYAFVNGEVGQYVQTGVQVTAGQTRQIADVQWTVPRTGTWLAWEIGTPDRDTTEFRHGNNYFMPYLYKGFAVEFPNPLVYTVGVSTPAKDWNYAQSGYHKQNAAPEPWKWQVKFDLADVPKDGAANLIVALAGSNKAHVQISVNGGSPVADFSPELDGGNALLRQGSHAKYSWKNVAIPLAQLHKGANMVEFVQTSVRDDASYVSYDYLALEMPGTPPEGK